jgi:hypothetical protein
MLPAIMLGAAVVGTAISMYGEYQDAQSKAEAEERQAALKRIQAQELMQREQINENVMREQEMYAEGDRVSLAGSQGTEGGWFGGMVRMRRDLQFNLETSRREANFKSYLLNQGAEIDDKLASDTRTAGYISMAGTAVSGAGKVYTAADKPSDKAASLPTV